MPTRPSARVRQAPSTRLPIDFRVEFAGDDAASAMGPALVYAGVRTLAKLLTTIVPMSSIVALLSALLWLAAALYLFAIVTWNRDDNWLGAGIVIGVSLFCGGIIAEVLGRIIGPGAIGAALLGIPGAAIALLWRSLLIVPLAGGFVAGARWITAEIGRSGT